jgi:hypothetical protein
MGEFAERYKQLVEEVEKGRKTITEAEIKAAEALKEQAQKSAGEFEAASDVATKTQVDAATQAESAARVYSEFKGLTENIEKLRESIGESAAGGEGEDEAAMPRRVHGALAKFKDVGGQAANAIKGAFAALGSTIQTAGVGGFIGLMLYGLKKEDQLRASGERYGQLWDKTIAGADHKGFETAQKHAANLGRQFADLVDTYRMSASEAQAVFRGLADTGVTATEGATKTSIQVDGARSSVAIATAAIDQTYRLSEGTAAKATGQVMQQYGMSAREAAEFVGTLAISGQEAGVGVQNFMTDVMSASGQLRQYGAAAEDGLNMAMSLKGMLEKGGLQPHFAATTAILATGQISAGLAGMSKGMQMVIAEKMGLGQDIAAYHALRDSYMDPEKGPGTAQRMAVELVGLFRVGQNITREEIGVAIEQVLPQVGPQASLIMIDAVATLTNTNSSKKERAAAQTAFNAAFSKERDRTSDFVSGFKDLARDIGQVGLGMFSLITVGLAEIVIGLRYVPLLLKEKFPILTGGLTETEKREKAQMEVAFDAVYDANIKALKMIKGGVVSAGKHMPGLLPSTKGLDALIQAATTPDTVKAWAASVGTEPQAQAISGMVGAGADMIRRVAVQSRGRLNVIESTLSPAESISLAGRAQSGDYAGVQEALGDEVRSAGEEAAEVAITGVEFKHLNNDGSITVSVNYAVFSSSILRRAAIRAAAPAATAAAAIARVNQANRTQSTAARAGRADVNAAIESVVASGIPRRFAERMARLESGLNPGSVGDTHIPQGSVGLYQVNRRMLERELQGNPRGNIARILQEETGGVLPSHEQLMDPRLNARLWASLAKGYLGQAKRRERELKAMGRSQFEGARFAAAGLPVTARTIPRIDPRTGRSVPRTEEETQALVRSWQLGDTASAPAAPAPARTAAPPAPAAAAAPSAASSAGAPNTPGTAWGEHRGGWVWQAQARQWVNPSTGGRSGRI